MPIALIAPWLHEAFYDGAQRRCGIEEMLTAVARAKDPAVAPHGPGTPSVAPAWPAGPPISVGRLTATPHAFTAAAEPAAGKVSSSTRDPQLGLDRGFVYTVRDYPDPFWIGRGTAAGDYDQDGWPDIAFGSDQGVIVYHNVGGKFERVDGPGCRISPTSARVRSRHGRSQQRRLARDLFVYDAALKQLLRAELRAAARTHSCTPVPNGGGVLTVSPAFADVDHDGYLDIFNGNMVLGVATGGRAYGAGRKNGFTFNHNLSFNYQPLRETRTARPWRRWSATSTPDGYVDLYQSNDFIVPDQAELRPARRDLAAPAQTRRRCMGSPRRSTRCRSTPATSTTTSGWTLLVTGIDRRPPGPQQCRRSMACRRRPYKRSQGVGDLLRQDPDRVLSPELPSQS